jgi:hypothetical protein
MRGIAETYRRTEAGDPSASFKMERLAEHPAVIQSRIQAIHKHHPGVWEELV